jgi:hypothetical protein
MASLDRFREAHGPPLPRTITSAGGRGRLMLDAAFRQRQNRSETASLLTLGGDTRSPYDAISSPANRGGIFEWTSRPYYSSGRSRPWRQS